MRRRRRAAILIAAALALSVGAVSVPSGSGAERQTAGDPEFNALVFSRTETFRHISIPDGLAMLRNLGSENDFGVEATEDPAVFTEANLERFDVVIFLLTTGDVLDPPHQRALRRYMKRGGGYLGIHSAADTEHEWPFYGRLVGAWFKSHPLQQLADFVTEAHTHPATAHLEPRFNVFDEHYSFKSNPRPNVRVLLSIDESTYSPDPNTSHLPGGPAESGVMGDHPMSWCHDNTGGRSFYTALGHESYLYSREWYRTHVLGGILTATKQVRAGCKPPPAAP